MIGDDSRLEYLKIDGRKARKSYDLVIGGMLLNGIF